VLVTHKRGTLDPPCVHSPVHGWHFDLCLVLLWLLFGLTVIKAVCRMLSQALPALAQTRRELLVLEPAAMGSARVLQVRPLARYHLLAPGLGTMCLLEVARSVDVAFETGIVQRIVLWFMHHCVCILLGLLLYSAA
jgi:hypothetical protein